MTINTALNRISLSILLDKEVTWEESDHLMILRKTSPIVINSNNMDLTRTVTKTVNRKDNKDTYYFDSTIQTKAGHVLLTHELRVILPHCESVLTEKLSPLEIKEFIALNEEAKENLHTHWIGKNDITKPIMEYAEELLTIKEKGKELSLK